MNGRVYLVGAGPGDPELLTVKALNILRRADAVLHDDLVSAEILATVPNSAFLYDVGKRSGQKSTRQEAIHFLMIELARQGLQVVRLKGGDPMIFGRAGEEIRALRRAGIEFEVVPGVTSALAAAAAAEISLTMRDTASSLLIITGHFAEGRDNDGWGQDSPSVGLNKDGRNNAGVNTVGVNTDGLANDRPLPDLRALLASGTTIALYMPGSAPRVTVNKLVAAGVALTTPCAMIARASLPDQQIILTTLEKLREAPTHAKPSILVVGDVARLSQHDRLRLAGVDRQALKPQLEIEQPEIAVAGWEELPGRKGISHG